MAGLTQAFRPLATVAITVTSGAATGTIPAGGSNLLITNGCADFVFVRIAGGAASAIDLPVAGGQRIMLDCPPSITSVSVFPNSTGGTVFATRGDGVVY